MFSHEKFSKDLAILWKKIFFLSPSATYLQSMSAIVQEIDGDPSLRGLVYFENASLLIEQLMVLLYNQHNIGYDLEDLRQEVRDGLYLWKNNLLYDNLSHQRKCFPCWK